MKLFVAMLLSLVCSTAIGQIKMVEKVSESNETWTGFLKPVVNEDGSITAAPGSKPVLAKASVKTVKYAFETAVPYQFGMLKVKRLSTGEKVSMEKDPTTGPAGEIYSFREGVPAGVYEFSYTVFDSVRGIDSDDWKIDYIPPKPTPPPDVITPVDPGPALQGLPEEARQAMLTYVKQMAGDMRTAAKEIKAGQLKTMPQVQQRGQALDAFTRTKWKESIGALMNKYQVDPPTDEMFNAIATGYEAVK